MNALDPTTPKKPQPRTPQNDALVEQLRDLGQGIGKTVVNDVVGGVAQDALSSLFGGPARAASKPAPQGQLQPNQPLNLHEKPAAAPRPFERFPFPPFRKREQFKPAFSQETINRLREQEAQVTRKIEEVRMELKQLVAEIRGVDKEIQKAIDQQLVDPGEYHLNFFDRLKAVLTLMLKEMRESRNWLSTHKSRKKQMGYWSQYKKKGTTFGLSHERTVATQVG